MPSQPTVSFTDERLANGLRLIIAVDRLLSIPLLGLGWLAPRLGFKVIFHLRPRDHKQ